MLGRQGGKCAICRRPPKRLRLAVDHNHAFDRIKLVSTKGKVWTVTADVSRFHLPERILYVHHKDKREAVRIMRGLLRAHSVRGLLCMICNRKVLGCMERFKVRPDAVEAYLTRFDPHNPLVSEDIRVALQYASQSIQEVR